MLRCTDKSKLIRLLEMLGKEAELKQVRLPSEETCMHGGPMDEGATHVLPTESRDVERGIAVVDDMVTYYTKCSPPSSEQLLTSGMASITCCFQ